MRIWEGPSIRRIPGLGANCRGSSRDAAFRGAVAAGKAERATRALSAPPSGFLVAFLVVVSWVQALGSCPRKKAKSPDPCSADPGVEAVARFA